MSIWDAIAAAQVPMIDTAQQGKPHSPAQLRGKVMHRVITMHCPGPGLVSSLRYRREGVLTQNR